jgi:uncharacterized protein (TIGR00375 family)
MNIDNLADYGVMKGLSLLGTGDFTHPKQFKEIKEKLQPIEGSGLFQYNKMKFMLSTEVSTVYEQSERIRKIHHIVYAPSFEVVEHINEELRRRGANLGADGRLLLNYTSPELVEILTEISKDIVVVPAHIWTPWFSCLGSKAGFNRIKDCYQEQTKRIFALETGLSSDPPMNWRLSELDRYTLMSNSDSHSPWPWRLGRECNVFDLEKITYWELWSAVRSKDTKRFLYTIEVDPSYGKYHFDGHRKCNINSHPKESIMLNNNCPKCGRKLTIGVLHRVDELADRPEGYIPENVIPFKRLIPLSELIKKALGINSLYSKKVWYEYTKLVKRFGSEINVLLNASMKQIIEETKEKIANLIMKNREGNIRIIPGYDGVYGEIIISGVDVPKPSQKFRAKRQMALEDFT